MPDLWQSNPSLQVAPPGSSGLPGVPLRGVPQQHVPRGQGHTARQQTCPVGLLHTCRHPLTPDGRDDHVDTNKENPKKYLDLNLVDHL